MVYRRQAVYEKKVFFIPGRVGQARSLHTGPHFEEWPEKEPQSNVIYAFIQSHTSHADPFASSFGGQEFSEDPFRGKTDMPALPPKKNVPPRPKPPSGKF